MKEGISMKESLKKSKIVFMIGIFLVVLGAISTMFYVNLKNQTTVIAEATVTYVGNQYIVVEDGEEEEYAIKTDQEYNVGDKISFTIKDVKKDSYPKEGTVEKIDTLSKSIKFSINDVVEEENVSEEEQTEQSQETTNNTSSQNQTNSNITNNSTDITTESQTKTAVISYFETLNTNLDTYSQDKSLGESIKSGFVTVVDFLFYGGTIKGKTFNELNSTAKLKVLKIALSIDKKIDQYFPGYKEQISTTGTKIYTNIKSKIVESYLDITTKVCLDSPDVCKAAKSDLADMKASFSLTWDFIKNISGVGLSKLKAWYEVWKTA